MEAEADLEDDHSSSCELVSFLVDEFRERSQLSWGSIDRGSEREGRWGLGVGFGVLYNKKEGYQREVRSKEAINEAHQPCPPSFPNELLALMTSTTDTDL